MTAFYAILFFCVQGDGPNGQCHMRQMVTPTLEVCMAEESRAYMAVTRAAAGAGDNLIEFQFECRKVVFEDQDA